MTNRKLILSALALGSAALMATLTLRLTEAQNEGLTVEQTEEGLFVSPNNPLAALGTTLRLSPTMAVDCTVSPSRASCVINVTVVDTRPIALEVYTPFAPLATDRWLNEETGDWGLTLHFSQVPCDFGRYYAKFVLKELLQGECVWDPEKRRRICPPQDVYGRHEAVKACDFLPSLPFGYTAPTRNPAQPTPPKTAPTRSPTPTKWRLIEATLTPTPAPEYTPTPRYTPGATLPGGGE